MRPRNVILFTLLKPRLTLGLANRLPNLVPLIRPHSAAVVAIRVAFDISCSK